MLPSHHAFYTALQINEENKLFMAGKASFFEKLTANSDLPKSVFEKEKEGDINKKTRALGDFDIHESQWFTHPELERLYRSVELDRQSIPPAVDSTTIGRLKLQLILSYNLSLLLTN